MSTSVSQLVKQVDNLVSLPGVFYRVNELVESPATSMEQIGDVISQDPGLTARVLRMANSAMYGFRGKVDTVGRALTTIGTKKLRDLVLATSTIEAFDGIPNELVTMEDFWSHSIRCGCAAKILAEKGGRKAAADSLFIAGLLHDIGQLVIFSQLPDASRAILTRAMEDVNETAVSNYEHEVLGFDHAELGAELVAHWHLPELFTNTIRYHHNPEAAEALQAECAVVHIANSIAVLAELDSTDIDETDAPPIVSAAWQMAGLDTDITAEVVHDTQSLFDEMRDLFLSPAA
ncbi:MAG TPA: HDOD domain-containing protein [Gammaproteobacteria bacterium]|nr:HDOD domain-containing protein [Gammaproteobacteria bacterium]